jgi:hypothetical protein
VVADGTVTAELGPRGKRFLTRFHQKIERHFQENPAKCAKRTKSNKPAIVVAAADCATGRIDDADKEAQLDQRRQKIGVPDNLKPASRPNRARREEVDQGFHAVMARLGDGAPIDYNIPEDFPLAERVKTIRRLPMARAAGSARSPRRISG